MTTGSDVAGRDEQRAEFEPAVPGPYPPGGLSGVAGLVLAAGQGRRFGRPKALVEVGGERLVDRAVRLIVGGGCHPSLVVSGAAPLDVAGAAVIDNPHWSGGMSTSLRVGLAALPDDVGAVIIVLVDTPWLGPASIQRLIAAHRHGAELAVATYDGRRAHPVLLGRQHWEGVVSMARGDAGARVYLQHHPDQVVEVDCTGTGDPSDIDRPEDAQRSFPPDRRLFT